MTLGLEQLVRILAGGLCFLIVLFLTALLLRVWYLMVRQKINGMVKILFHVLMAADMFVLNVATLLMAGIWFRGVALYRLAISMWMLITAVWLFSVIIYALICVTKELYRDTRRTPTAGHH